MMFMETRFTETTLLNLYFSNNDYIDDGGIGDDPDEKELEPGFGDEDLGEDASSGVGDDDDNKGGLME